MAHFWEWNQAKTWIQQGLFLVVLSLPFYRCSLEEMMIFGSIGFLGGAYLIAGGGFRNSMKLMNLVAVTLLAVSCAMNGADIQGLFQILMWLGLILSVSHFLLWFWLSRARKDPSGQPE